MPINIDPSKIKWDKIEQIDPNKVQWEDDKEETTPSTAFDTAARSIGISGRTIAQGLASLLGVVHDPLATLTNMALGTDVQPLRQATKKLLSDMGVPDYEGKTEEFIGNLGELAVETAAGAGAAGAITKGVKTAAKAMPKGFKAFDPAKPATKVAESLADEPVKQIVTGSAAYTGGKAVEEALPDTGVVGQIAGQLVGGLAGAKATGMGKAATPKYKTPEAVKRGEELGVDVMTSDIIKPKSAVGRAVQFASERTPHGTTGMRVKQVEQQKEMVKNYINEVGADVPQDVKSMVVEDVTKKRKEYFQRYSKMKDEVFNPLARKGSVPVPKLTTVIDDEIQKAEFRGMNRLVNDLTKLKDQITSAVQPAGKGKYKQANVKSLDEARALFGEDLADEAYDKSRKRVNRVNDKIYAAFKEDLGNFIKKEGKPGDYKKWQAVNKKLRNMFESEKMLAFKKVLKQAKVQPEVVKTMIHTQDASVAKQLYKSASPQGKKYIRAAMIQDIVEKSGGIDNITPEKFVREVSKRGRATGIYFDTKNRKVLNAMAELIKDVERSGEAAKYKPISILMPMFGVSSLTSIFGGGTVGAAGAVGAMSSLGLLSRLIESKPTRDLLLRIQHLKKHHKIPNRDKELEAAVRKYVDMTMALQKQLQEQTDE